MPKLKAVIQKDEENEELENENIIDDGIVESVPEKKAERFFEELPTDKEVKITTYKKSSISKTWEQCGKSLWLSDGEFNYDDVIDLYGSGLYQFFAHIRNEKGKMVLYDSCVKRFAEQPKTIINNLNPQISAAEMKKQAFDELRMYKELFPPEQKNNDTNVLILKMMEMVQNINEKQTAAQRESEKRMYEALEKMNEKTGNSKQEFLEMFEMFNTFQSNMGGGESSALEKLLPMIGPVIPGLINQFTSKPAAPLVALPAPVAATGPTENELIEKLIEKIPPEIFNKVTRENISTVIDNSIQKNTHLSRDILTKVFEQILIKKGL